MRARLLVEGKFLCRYRPQLDEALPPATPEENLRDSAQPGDLADAEQIAKPTVARIRGDQACGGGVGLGLPPATLPFARRAQFALTEVRLGIIRR